MKSLMDLWTMVFVCTLNIIVFGVVFLCITINYYFGVVFYTTMCQPHVKIFIYFISDNFLSSILFQTRAV
jgi:hypothetical protein